MQAQTVHFSDPSCFSSYCSKAASPVIFTTTTAINNNNTNNINNIIISSSSSISSGRHRCYSCIVVLSHHIIIFYIKIRYGSLWCAVCVRLCGLGQDRAGPAMQHLARLRPRLVALAAEGVRGCGGGMVRVGAALVIVVPASWKRRVISESSGTGCHLSAMPRWHARDPCWQIPLNHQRTVNPLFCSGFSSAHW